jgi:transcriptional accessory protein Tex/SPT6
MTPEQELEQVNEQIRQLSKRRGELQTLIDKQNAALDKLSSESLARLERTRLESLAALKAEQEYTQRLRAKFEAEKTALLERMENMTACEACNESWLEVVR